MSVRPAGVTRPSRSAVLLLAVLAMLATLLPSQTAHAQTTPPYDRGIGNACSATMRGFSPFSDVRSGTHRGAISCIAFYGVTQGGAGTASAVTYDPLRPVTREQMASFIARMVNRVDGYRLPVGPPRAFPDSTGEHARNIDRLAAVGIVEGRGGRFDRRGHVTREQMASFVSRALEEVSGRNLPVSNVFDGAGISSAHQRNVGKLAAVGVVAGRGGGVYGPTMPVTRQEMASFIARGLDYLAVNGRTLTPETPEFRQTLGSFTTHMTPGQPRNHNIRLGASYLDGTVIPPGQRLSLNAAIGQRTSARGFRPNGFISGGILISVVGGGVSQLATTFMNAAWFSGVELITHRPHSQYFTRYPPGREATITWNTLDTVVRNDSPLPMTVRASSTPTSVTISFVGTPWGRTTSSWTDGPSNPRSGQAFTVRYGRTVTFPDGSSRSSSYSHTYQSPGG